MRRNVHIELMNHFAKHHILILAAPLCMWYTHISILIHIEISLLITIMRTDFDITKIPLTFWGNLILLTLSNNEITDINLCTKKSNGKFNVDRLFT